MSNLTTAPPVEAPLSPTDSSSLETVSAILLGKSADDITELRSRLDDAHQRIATLQHDLPSAIAQCALDGPTREKLITALQAPVESAIQRSVTIDETKIASAISPIMGSTIMRYLTEFYAHIMEAVNKKVEIATSPKRLFWAIKARFKGMSYESYLEQKFPKASINEICVFDKNSLTLLGKASNDADIDQLALDSSEPLGIQKSIQNHLLSARESNQPVRGLVRATVNGVRVLMIEGRNTYFSATVSGLPSATLIEETHALANRIDQHFMAFDGNEHLGSGFFTRTGENLDAKLQTGLIEEESAPLKPNKFGLWGFYTAAAACALLACTLWGLHAYRMNTLITKMRTTPGIELIAIESNWGKKTLLGLRDPLAQSPEEIIEAAGLNPQRFDLHFESYHSLAEPFATQRRTIADLEKTALIEEITTALASGQRLDPKTLLSKHP